MAAPAFNIPSQGFSSGEAVGATLTNIQPVGDGQLGFVFPGSSVVIPNVNLVAAGTYRYGAALLPLHDCASCLALSSLHRIEDK